METRPNLGSGNETQFGQWKLDPIWAVETRPILGSGTCFIPVAMLAALVGLLASISGSILTDFSGADQLLALDKSLDCPA